MRFLLVVFVVFWFTLCGCPQAPLGPSPPLRTGADAGTSVQRPPPLPGTIKTKPATPGWVRLLPSLRERIGKVALDTAGNIYIAGGYSQETTLGGLILPAPIGGGMFVAKMSPEGDYVWLATSDTDLRKRPGSLTVNSLGQTYVVGLFLYKATFGKHILVNDKQRKNLFVAKLGAHGKWLWAKAFPLTKTLPPVEGAAVALDQDENLVIATQDGNRLLLATVTSSGDLTWLSEVTSSKPMESCALKIDPQGHVVVSGVFLGTVSFGTKTLTSSGLQDLFVAKASKEGKWIWARRIGGRKNDYSYDIAVDAWANIYITGMVEGSITVGKDEYQSTHQRMFLSKWDSSGTPRWTTLAEARSLQSKQSSAGYGLFVDKEGAPFVVGAFQSILSLGTISLSAPSYRTTSFVAKASPSGRWLWALQAGRKENVDGENFGLGVVVAPTQMYVLGEMYGSVSFDQIRVGPSSSTFIWQFHRPD